MYLDIVVMGNIGAGKTDLINKLKLELPFADLVPEQYEDNVVLPMFYEEMKNNQANNGAKYN